MRKWRVARSFRVLCCGRGAVVRCDLIEWLILFVLAADCFGDTARLSGTIYTVDAHQEQVIWPNARITLRYVTTGREASTVSNELGQYLFAGVLSGEYELRVALAGFEPVTKRIALHSDSPNTVDIQLAVQKQSESVSVSANPTG